MRLSLLLPARKHVESATTVARWLVRGDRTGHVAPGRDAALHECFSIGAAILPTAALTRSLDANDAADALWLRADPAFVMADAVTLRLLACGDLGLSADETQALAQALKPVFGDAGFTFDAPHPARWYLRCERGTLLPKFSAPEDALGDDLANHLPEGEHARRWRSLLNEAQIVLTQHPLNARRVQRGLPPANSLWFWGAGVLPNWVRSVFTHVYGDDEVVVALAKLAKVSDVGKLKDAAQAFSFLPAFLSEERPGEGTLSSAAAKAREMKQRNQKPPSPNPPPRTVKLFGGEGFKEALVLIDLGRYRDIAALDAGWLAPIDAALKVRCVDTLHLLFESGERYSIKPVHRWRFWRRFKPAS